MSDDSDEENVIRYGTPLEPYEEDEVPSKRKFQQQSDQYAVDEHGRRRFHGAFTGGFSAGYGNTVGTAEGWTPSSFKSSRSEKAQSSSQKPEDFMDEEDRSEFGIAPRSLQTMNEFSGQKRPRQHRYHDGPIPGEPVLEQLIRPVHETAAVRMLRNMGWKEGQGIGDRVSKRDKKRANEQHKVYGCFMPDDMKQATQKSDTEPSSDSEYEYESLFAPDDYEPYRLQHKSDVFGLGYKGLSRHSVLGNMATEHGKSHLVMREKGKKVSIRGQAFGVGAFEGDDEDIYASEDMSHYDFELGGNDRTVTKKKIEKGGHVLQGFVKSSRPTRAPPSYPAPALPRDFAPVPAGARRTRFDGAGASQRDQGLGRHELTAEARGALLGETPIIIKEQAQTQQQQTDTQQNIETKITTIDLTAPVTEKPADFISIKDNNGSLNVFKPFSSDPQKQLRYENYVKDKSVVSVSGDRLSQWEKNRELMEFEQAAKLYRPLSGVMGDRFTHASQPDDALNPLSAVDKSSINYGLASQEQIEAAKIGAYGLMTRKVTSWRPEAIVCKRFNIPEVGDRPEPKKSDKQKVSYSIFSYLESSVHDKESFTKEQTKFSGSKSLNMDNIKNGNEKTNINIEKNNKIQVNKPPEVATVSSNKRLTVAELFIKESEKELQSNNDIEPKTIERFDRMDLYKSIFLSDSEGEDDKINSETKMPDDFIEKPKNIERNLSPPRGIFANIDFDELNSWKRNSDDKKSKTEEVPKNNVEKPKLDEKVTKNDEEVSINVEEVYGPKIPENLQKRLEVPQESFKPVFRTKDQREEESSSSDSWVEAKAKCKKDKKKKNKKHKSKKKSKHKKKDK